MPGDKWFFQLDQHIHKTLFRFRNIPIRHQGLSFRNPGRWNGILRSEFVMWSVLIIPAIHLGKKTTERTASGIMFWNNWDWQRRGNCMTWGFLIAEVGNKLLKLITVCFSSLFWCSHSSSGARYAWLTQINPTLWKIIPKFFRLERKGKNRSQICWRGREGNHYWHLFRVS